MAFRGRPRARLHPCARGERGRCDPAGSLTLGAYVPGSSDIDLLVILQEPLTDAQLAALTEAVAVGRLGAPGRVDLRVVLRKVAAAPTPAPPIEASIEIRPDREAGFRVEHHLPGQRDLLVEFSICRALGRTLMGSAPRELIGEVPNEWVLSAGDAQLADWQAIRDDPAYAQLTVLTACRVWRFVEEGCHCSKMEAGEWALERDPTLQVVRDALGQRLVDATIPIDAEQVQQLLAIVRARLAERRATA